MRHSITPGSFEPWGRYAACKQAPHCPFARGLAAVAARYQLEEEALEAVVQSALAAPDRVVNVEVKARAPA